jgi:oligopeptide/dipeptide ABC transporter ATP-binding protein
MAMIVITHDMGVIAEVADEVVVMYAGQVVEQAPATELFARPEHPYTEALLGALPQLEDNSARTGRLTSIPGRPPDLLFPPEGCRFAARCPYADEPDRCATHMPELRELRPRHLVRSEHPTSERARPREAAPV